jgi:hypothetical protein
MTRREQREESKEKRDSSHPFGMTGGGRKCKGILILEIFQVEGAPLHTSRGLFEDADAGLKSGAYITDARITHARTTRAR